MTSLYAIIAAAGNGQRMNLPHSKVISEIAGTPAICRALKPFLELGIACVVMTRPGDCPYVESLTSTLEGVTVRAGGQTRGESVWLGLSYLRQERGLDDADIVLVHDGARCLTSRSLIERVVSEAGRSGAAVPGLPVTDTLKRIDDQRAVIETVDRQGLVAVQTPQGFRADILVQAYESGGFEASDDAGLLEKKVPVTIVDGESDNIKITYARDLAIAESLLLLRDCGKSR